MNVSEFLLDAGITAANQALADRRHFVLNDEQWRAFQQALDAPPQPLPRLEKLMTELGLLDGTCPSRNPSADSAALTRSMISIAVSQR